MPIFPFYVLNLGGSVGLATFLMALYSGAVVITTPILGCLSDYYGKKPVLMLSLLGVVVGYVILGFAHAVWMVGLARSGAERGGVMGVYSSAGMAGRNLGTVATGTIMERTFVHAPYILAIFIAVGGCSNSPNTETIKDVKFRSLGR